MQSLGNWTLLSIRFTLAVVFLRAFVEPEQRTLVKVKELAPVSLAGLANPVFLYLALPMISVSVVQVDAKIELSVNRGLVLLLLGVVSFTLFGFLSSKATKKETVSPTSVAFHLCLLSFLVTAPIAAVELFIAGGFKPSLAVRHVLIAVVLGFVSTG